MSSAFIGKQELNVTKKQVSSGGPWADVIGYAKAKLERTKLYITQLEAMILWFEAQKQAGEPCPTEVSETFRQEKQIVAK
jgi:hypothetical protein